jgi:ribosome-associated protein
MSEKTLLVLFLWIGENNAPYICALCIGHLFMTKKIIKKDATALLLDSIVFGMQERKAKDIVVMDLRKIDHAMTDYFVICHGTSTTQVQSLAQSVEEQTMRLSNEKPLHIEGQRNSNWILMDYVNVIVHVFETSARTNYSLEELWSDGLIEHIASQD